MATKMYIDDRFACPARTLYELILDKDFDQAQMDAIRMKKEYLEEHEVPGGLVQKLKMYPGAEMPESFLSFDRISPLFKHSRKPLQA